MASLTINCNTMDPLPLRSRLLGVSLFILLQPAPSWKCLRSSLCHWRHFHLHKAAHKLKALSGKKKKIPAHSRKIQQLNLDKGWGVESCSDLLFYFYPKNRVWHSAGTQQKFGENKWRMQEGKGTWSDWIMKSRSLLTASCTLLI